MLKKEKIYIRRLIIILATGLLILFSFSNLSAVDLEGLQCLSDDELSDIRGRYAGAYFSYDFSGYWDSLGNADAKLDYAGNLGDIVVGGPPPDLPSGSNLMLNNGDQQIKVQAMVGNIEGTQGIIQISQVPGNNNVVTTVMNVQLTVINVKDPAEAARLFENLTTP